jgi:hypothetical protein
VTHLDNSTQPDDDAPFLTSEDIACLGMRKVDPPFGDLFRDLGFGARGERVAFVAGRPRRRKPRLKTVLDQGRKAGATSVTVDGVTYALGQATEHQTDIDRELAEFGRRRHGKA